MVVVVLCYSSWWYCTSLFSSLGCEVGWMQPQDDCPTHLQVPGSSPNLQTILTTDCAQFREEFQKQVLS